MHPAMGGGLQIPGGLDPVWIRMQESQGTAAKASEMEFREWVRAHAVQHVCDLVDCVECSIQRERRAQGLSPLPPQMGIIGPLRELFGAVQDYRLAVATEGSLPLDHPFTRRLDTLLNTIREYVCFIEEEPPERPEGPWWRDLDHTTARDALLLAINPIPEGVCVKCGLPLPDTYPERWSDGTPARAHVFLCPGEEY